MRRAVAACTSPEVFFGTGANTEAPSTTSMSTDPLGLAMEALSISAQA